MGTELLYITESVFRGGAVAFASDTLFFIPYNSSLRITVAMFTSSHAVGPCHHGMTRPQVADRGTASDKEGNCE